MARKHALTGVLIAVALFLPVPAGATADRQQTAVPAYWGPDTPEGMAIFHRLAQNRPTNGIVVLNGSRSRPELPSHPAWATAIGRLAATGTKTLVYVDTGYHGIDFGHGSHRTRDGGTSIPEWSAQIRRDIDDWYDAYGADGISGVFLDQTILLCGKDDDYARLYAGIRDHIRARHADAYIVINPGAPAEQCYEDVADTMVSFEGDFATYLTHTSPDWQRDHPNPRKFWHLIHNVPTADDMRAVVARSKANNAGFVYTTELRMEPYPWSGLTSYWDAQLVAASGITDTTPPQAPAGLTATTRADQSVAKVRLTWQTPVDDVAVAGYEVSLNGTKIADTYDNAYQATSLPHATLHEFTVRARDAAGNLSAPSGPLVITTPSGGPPLTDASVCLSPAGADYRVSFGPAFSHHRVFIDSDDNQATGWHLPPGLPAGVDLMIENAFLYRYTGPGWAWERVPDVQPLVAEKAGSFHWRVPAAGQSRQVVVFSGFTAEDPPEEYSAPITVEQVPDC